MVAALGAFALSLPEAVCPEFVKSIIYFFDMALQSLARIFTVQTQVATNASAMKMKVCLDPHIFSILSHPLLTQKIL